MMKNHTGSIVIQVLGILSIAMFVFGVVGVALFGNICSQEEASRAAFTLYQRSLAEEELANARGNTSIVSVSDAVQSGGQVNYFANADGLRCAQRRWLSSNHDACRASIELAGKRPWLPP